MALSLTGSKRWPKWKVLKKFAKQHCALNSKKADLAVDEVSSARDKVLPLMHQLSVKHPNFQVVAEAMVLAIKQPF
jgi:serine/threonine-protein kinase HipA